MSGHKAVEMRRFLAVLFLLILAAGLWMAARWSRHRDDLRVSVVFDSASGLRKGSRVMSKGRVIGQVTGVAALEKGEAVSVRIVKSSRSELMTDSLFSVGQASGKPVLIVTNTIAVGRPLEDGAVIRVREDKISRWIARHGEKLGPLLGKVQRKASELIDQYQEGKLDAELDKIREKIPEWRREGDEVLTRRLEELSDKINDLDRPRLRDHPSLRHPRNLRDACQSRKAWHTPRAHAQGKSRAAFEASELPRPRPLVACASAHASLRRDPSLEHHVSRVCRPASHGAGVQW